MAKKSRRRRAAERVLPAKIEDIEAKVEIEPEDELALTSAFFTSSPSTAPVAIEIEPADASPEPTPAPHVTARRARFTRYVRGVVAVGMAICAVATVRVAIARVGNSPAPATVRANAAPVLPVVPKAPEPEIAPQVEAATTPTLNAAEGAALARRAQLALESKRVLAAIEDGERATTLAPTDAYAWLVLGAAYEAKGDAAQARRCYRTCKDRSSAGPFNECAALLLR